MSVGPESANLNGRHRTTLAAIFRHPLSHNVEWSDVLSLLRAIDAVRESREGYEVSLGGATRTFVRSRDKDLAADDLAHLRRMLAEAGYRVDPD
jgi:hypothetical protein